ncbi:MAG: OmpH family outer membrane protein [Planctomycetota bacterium]
MNIKRWIVASLALTVTLGAADLSHVAAQTRVAIVDIGKVFKNHPQFSSQLAALKQEADQFKSQAVQQQQNLMQRGEALSQYQPDSEDYRTEETRLAQESASLQLSQRDKMRSLMQQEARLHYNTYAQVYKAISDYCDANSVQLVLRYNSTQMDPKNPSSVMQKVNGSVIFHNQQNDITTAIIDSLKQSTASLESNLK